mmetsp:Transcript_15738/g.53660  ORF Transcript_15738/g.53660 Transcript_15738/m.53660 type:complete len:243 (-) Transcript_15738:158-886(-)
MQGRINVLLSISAGPVARPLGRSAAASLCCGAHGGDGVAERGIEMHVAGLEAERVVVRFDGASRLAQRAQRRRDTDVAFDPLRRKGRCRDAVQESIVMRAQACCGGGAIRVDGGELLRFAAAGKLCDAQRVRVRLDGGNVLLGPERGVASRFRVVERARRHRRPGRLRVDAAVLRGPRNVRLAAQPDEVTVLRERFGGEGASRRAEAPRQLDQAVDPGGPLQHGAPRVAERREVEPCGRVRL